MHRDEHDETECIVCGLLRSDCACNRTLPTKEQLEEQRESRLVRAERRGEEAGR